MTWDPDISFEGFREKIESWYKKKDFEIGDPPIDAQYALDLIFKTLIDDDKNYPYLTTMPESVEQTNGIILDLILTKYSKKYRRFKKNIEKEIKRGEKGMKAIYQKYPPCESCIDMYGLDIVYACRKCMADHKYEVDILKLGVGIFGNKAVIKKKDGEVETVPISSLKIVGESYDI